ncbi:MAG: hypothetical protein KJZ87_11370 [Thermoguttaceae bacterium]|nr:hypothetical protein [Thermoguttaceae bacterium]
MAERTHRFMRVAERRLGRACRATVDDVITDSDFVIKLVALETIGPAQIAVACRQGSLSQMATGPRSPASPRYVSRLAIIAALSEGPEPKRRISLPVRRQDMDAHGEMKPLHAATPAPPRA